MALKRHSKRAYVGLRVAVRLSDGFYYQGVVDNVLENGVLGTTYYIGGLKNFPLKYMKVKEDCLYGPSFQQVGQSTKLKCGQPVFITYNGREVSGHVTGRLLKGKVKVSLDSEVDDVIVRCENIRFLESRKSPRLNESSQRVPVKRELSETIEVPERQQLYFRLGDGEEYTPSPKTLKNDPLLLEGNDQDIISAAHTLTSMSRSPSTPPEDSKGLPKFFYKGTTYALSSPKSWNDSALSLGYHSQTSPGQSPHHLSSSAPAHDLANVSANSDDADMFSYFGGDLDPAKPESKIRPRCIKKIKYVCTYPRCDQECDSTAAIKAHVRTHLGRRARGPDDSGLLDEEQSDIPEEDFYFDEVEVDELTSSISLMRTSTPPSDNQNPFQAQLASQLLSQSRQMSPPSTADGTPLSPVLTRKLDHDYVGKEPASQDRPDLLRVAFHQTLLACSGSSTLLGSSPGVSLLSHAAMSALFPPIPVSGLYPQTPLQQQHNVPQLSPSSHPAPPAPKTAAASHSTRRPRNDVKKCRKMYGIENRDQWCKDCKWKKACKRFTNANNPSKADPLRLSTSPSAQVSL